VRYVSSATKLKVAFFYFSLVKGLRYIHVTQRYLEHQSPLLKSESPEWLTSLDPNINLPLKNKINFRYLQHTQKIKLVRDSRKIQITGVLDSGNIRKLKCACETLLLLYLSFHLLRCFAKIMPFLHKPVEIIYKKDFSLFSLYISEIILPLDNLSLSLIGWL